jgi:hypothetical protein
MKILINRSPIDGPWGGGNNFVSAFVKVSSEKGHKIIHTFEPGIDVLFIQDPRPDSSGISINEIVQYKNKNPNCQIIQRINECDARKNTEHMDGLLLQCSQFLNKTIFVSEWMKEYFLKKGWRCNNNFSLHNGVNKEIFKGSSPKGSDLISVVAHHWSNNLLKGFDAYEFLDYLAGKNLINFTYIGRHRNSFDNTKIVEPCHGKKLAKELSSHNVYISGSRFDPGPNHILEALSADLPTYVHIDGGGAVEFAGKNHTFKNLNELENLILNKNFKKNDYIPISWKECIENYLEAIEK